ncbi:TetR/AcrR family transcriptional regulator [Kribbella sp. WER1]
MTAADDVFGRSPGASTDDVAKLAGVGIATVFRHFATKTELLEAVLTLRLERIRDRALELTGSADPGAAFYEFFTQVVAESASKLAIAEALTASGAAAGEQAREAGRSMREAFDGLLVAAQKAGAVRPDAQFPEVYALLIGSSRGATASALDAETRDRMLALVYDGLKPRL